MKTILVLNLGSTSFKCKLYQMGEAETVLAAAAVESIGSIGTVKVQVGGQVYKESCACKDHMEAMALCLQTMRDSGVAVDMQKLDAVGYKAVHGGSISGSRVVDEALLGEMERMIPFAPAHNPVYLNMMRAVREQNPKLTQIACFETAFHATMPMERAVYGVPVRWARELGVRRYGFHGSSHSYIAWKMAEDYPEAKRVISVHLGGSSSICAIHNGRSVAASMGATPQSGLFHNNRVGDFDVFCLPALVEELGSLDNVLSALSTQSGILGLSGVSNDMRLVIDAANGGNEDARLALDAFNDNIVGYIGMYTAYMGGVDAICFTGGIGTNDPELRRKVADKLGFIGAKMDTERNVRGVQGQISAEDSGVLLCAMETNEELMVARSCFSVLS